MGTPTSATEIERLVVRLVGDGSSYDKMMDNAVATTKQAVRQITVLTKKQMDARNAALEEGARITQAVTTPVERYAEALADLNRLYKSGHISQETYNRAIRKQTAALPSVQAAQARYNREVVRAKEITNAAVRPAERYRTQVAEIKRIHASGMITTETYRRSIKKLSTELGVGRAKLGAYGDKLRTIGQTMKSFGTRMMFTVTLPIVGAGVAMLKMASSLETTRIQFETLLGKDQGRALLNNLRQFAAVTPFRFTGVSAAGRTLLSFGVEQRDVLKTLQMLGDVAAGTGKDFRALAVIFGQIRGMGRLQGQDFLQLVTAGFPVIEIAKTMGVSMKVLRQEMEKGNVPFKVVEKTFERLTSKGGKFAGMMENLSKTTAGRFSNLLDNLEMLTQRIGTKFLPSANKFLDWLIGVGEKIDKLNDSTIMTVATVFGLAALVGPLAFGLGAVTIAVAALWKAMVLLEIASAATLFEIALIGAAVLLVTDALTGGKLGFIEWISTIRLGSTSLGTFLQIAGLNMQDNWRGIMFHIGKSFTWLGHIGTKAFLMLKKVGLTVAGALAEGFAKAFNKVIQVVLDAADIARRVAEKANLLDTAESKDLKTRIAGIKASASALAIAVSIGRVAAEKAALAEIDKLDKDHEKEKLKNLMEYNAAVMASAKARQGIFEDDMAASNNTTAIESLLAAVADVKKVFSEPAVEEDVKKAVRQHEISITQQPNGTTAFSIKGIDSNAPDAPSTGGLADPEVIKLLKENNANQIKMMQGGFGMGVLN